MAPVTDESTKTENKPMAPMAYDTIKKEVKSITPMKVVSHKKEANRGAWTAEEDKKLAEAIAIHGPKKWKTIATKAGLNRCGKSCRLRWMNYLRPNIKRGNISDQEEDLILRLHKLLGNRWSLIAGRLPGRTDNEIKNYWNSHLSKKINQNEKQISGGGSNNQGKRVAGQANVDLRRTNHALNGSHEDSNINFDVDEFFDFSDEGPLNLEWVSKFLSDSGLV